MNLGSSSTLATTTASQTPASPQIVPETDAPTGRPAPLLTATDLHVTFGQGPTAIQAVRGVSLTIPTGQTLALVGESGCGKSTTARALLQLLRPTAGEVHFAGQELTRLWRRRLGRWIWGPELRQLRRHMQLVFQDPYASLNPRMTVFELIAEPLRAFDVARGAALQARVADALERVGLDPGMQGRYPHAFSGGQRQRLGIARALTLAPRLLVADEPISALDVSIQAQILNLLADLQDSLGLTYLLVAHDLAVVRHFSREVAVMYRGRIVEAGSTEAVFAGDGHPYTRSLLAAAGDRQQPAPAAAALQRNPVPGLAPLATAVVDPQGCAYAPACAERLPICAHVLPPLVQLGGGRVAHCHWLAQRA